ncbi:MAG: Dabb family protein [Eubacteriales bacterium]|nr:Dabb family protein [Eubacteriales bacterium]
MKHYIIAKYKEEVTKQEKEKLLRQIKELFSHLLEINGITQVNVEPNCVDRSNRYDIMIEIEMRDETVLCVYDDCSWHHKWKDEYGHLLEKKTIFDRP